MFHYAFHQYFRKMLPLFHCNAQCFFSEHSNDEGENEHIKISILGVKFLGNILPSRRCVLGTAKHDTYLLGFIGLTVLTMNLFTLLRNRWESLVEQYSSYAKTSLLSRSSVQNSLYNMCL